MPSAQTAAAITVPNTANMVMVLGQIVNSKCRVKCGGREPDVFEKVQLVEAVTMLEQDHRQKIQENGAGLINSIRMQALEAWERRLRMRGMAA